MWNDIPKGFSLLEEEETGAFSDVPEGFSVTDSPSSWRAEIMSELDENPARQEADPPDAGYGRRGRGYHGMPSE